MEPPGGDLRASASADPPRLLGGPLALVLGTSFVYFIGFGITMPALPLYVVE